MIVFAHPVFLWLLLAVPVLPVLFGLGKALRRRRIRALGDEALVRELMPSVSAVKPWIRIILLSLSLGMLALGLARPQVGAKLSQKESKGVEIMIALDVSNSMLAEDYAPNRLERAKLAVSKLVDRLDGDRIGLILFAGSAFVQLPVTTDYVSAKMFLSSVSTESVQVQGTAIGEAIRLAVKSFSPQSEKSRAVIVITDGENHEDNPVKMAAEAFENGVRVFAVGVGTPEGKPIPMNGEYIKDRDGNIVVTRLDEETLQKIASEGGGAYVRAGNGEFGLNPIVDSIRRMDKEKFDTVVFEEYNELFMYCFGAALLLLALALLLSSRRNPRRLFAGGKGFLLLFALLLSLPSYAGDPRVKELRRGNRDFSKSRWREAEVDYRKAMVLDSTAVDASYNLGNTLYRLGDYQQAAKVFQAVEEGAKASGHQADFQYNKGNVAAAQEDWGTAVEAYRQSLLENPGDLDAKENYLYAKAKYDRQQQQQQQNQDQNQNQDNKQDQNQDQDNKQDQNQNQDNKQNQDQDNRQDQNRNQDRSQEPQVSPQAAQQMLQAIQEREKETQEKVNKEKAALVGKKKRDKNW